MTKVTKLHKAAPKREWSGALEEYLLFKKAQGLRDITVKGHRNVMELFFKRHPQCWPDEVKELDTPVLATSEVIVTSVDGKLKSAIRNENASLGLAPVSNSKQSSA